MKVRDGFVSNSSSSSFILNTAEDIDLAKKYGIKFYRIKDILSVISPVVVAINDLKKTVGDCYDDGCVLPWFVAENLIMELPLSLCYYDMLVELFNNNPNVCVTDSFDRDRAYELGIYSKLKLFKGDL